ncbi:MAG: RNA polymerase sigma factor [Actinomycetota bacterium]
MNDERRPVVVSSADARSAAADVLERIAPLVRRALVARYGVEAGGEAAGDAVAWGWEHGDVLCEMANPGGYLYRVGQTAARRGRRRVVRSAFPVEPVWQDAPDLSGDVFDALFRLRPDQRVAVLLVHGYQFSYRDTAAVMGVSEDSVRNHVHRGMRKLRADLEARTEGGSSS